MSDELTAALSLKQLDEKAKMLKPLAKSGNVEAQTHLAAMMMFGCHRFATYDERNTWYSTATDAELRVFEQEQKADVEQAVQWLENASNQGIGAASHNLAMAYLNGAGSLAPEERRTKVKELLGRARQQGFAFFGPSEGDEAYLATLEGYAKSKGVGMPWESSPPSHD